MEVYGVAREERLLEARPGGIRVPKRRSRSLPSSASQWSLVNSLHREQQPLGATALDYR
jgi:hypothetical protein